MQLYCQLGRLTLRVATTLGDKTPTPSDDTPSPHDEDHPHAGEGPRVVGFVPNAAE